MRDWLSSQWIGIPTCIGIGPTQTLAKLANHIAKTAERHPGSYPIELAQVCNLASLALQVLEAVLAATAVRDRWGIGPKLGEQLQAGGIHTVLDLARMPPATAKAGWSVVLERTVRELQGVSCNRLRGRAPAQGGDRLHPLLRPTAAASSPGQTCSTTSSASTTRRVGTRRSATSARYSSSKLEKLRLTSIEPAAAHALECPTGALAVRQA